MLKGECDVSMLLALPSLKINVICMGFRLSAGTVLRMVPACDSMRLLERGRCCSELMKRWLRIVQELTLKSPQIEADTSLVDGAFPGVENK